MNEGEDVVDCPGKRVIHTSDIISIFGARYYLRVLLILGYERYFDYRRANVKEHTAKACTFRAMAGNARQYILISGIEHSIIYHVSRYTLSPLEVEPLIDC